MKAIKYYADYHEEDIKEFHIFMMKSEKEKFKIACAEAKQILQ